jgi:hypothetical protein
LLDSAEDVRNEIYETIKNGTRANFEELIGKILKVTEGEAAQKRVIESREYILSNWSAAKVRLTEKEGIIGCSAEGHVSHVLSSRMSSRPMGWSKIGADKMARLRAYYWNGGRMLELVKEQKKELPRAVGAEENDIISSAEMLRAEKNRHKEIGKYFESINHRISEGAKKYVWFYTHIWGL